MTAIGLQCGFGAPLGAPVLEQLRLLGFTILRLDLQRCDQATTTALAQEVIDAGLQPLCIIRRPEQMTILPSGALIELGNEPDLEHEHFPIDEYIEVAEVCVDIALARGLRLYLGAVSNLNMRGVRFLRSMPWPSYPSQICCSIHRYPNGPSPQKPHAGFKSREDEVETLRRIVGDRALACSEVGYHDAPGGWSETAVADNMAWERQFFSAQGFEICSGYQLNDGPDPEPINHYGFRRAGGSWKPVAFAFANTSFPPLDGLTISLQSDHARFLGVQQNQTAVATSPEANAWETLAVEQLGGDQVALRSWQWHYLTAELDASVRARSTIIGPWETWTLEPLPDGRVAFRSAHGKYLAAELNGTLGFRDAIGPWESWTSDPPNWWVEPPAVTNPNRLVGQLHRERRVIGDEGGVQVLLAGRRQAMARPRVLMFCHFMEAFSAWCHDRQAEVESQCRVIAEHYAGIRALDVLGYWDGAWRGKEVTPIPFRNYSGEWVAATPNYWEQKRAFLEMLHALGLRLMDDRGDMNSWSLASKLEHLRANGEFYRALPMGREVLAGVWAANEGWQNGGDSIALCQQMLRAFQQGAGTLPALCGLSAPGGDSDPDKLAQCSPPMSSWEPEMPCSFANWSANPASVVTCHGNRGAHEHIVEHYFGYGYDESIRQIGKPVFNTEPVGPGSGVSVGQVNDPELLCALTVAALIGGQAWTYMSGFGVFWEGRIETQPGFAEVARLPSFLPQDIATWPTVAHSGTRFRGTRILAAVDPTRADQAISADGRFAIVIHTQEQAGNALPCERGCSEFTVINMLTGTIERSGPLRVGETYRHPGVARLAIGRLA